MWTAHAIAPATPCLMPPELRWPGPTSAWKRSGLTSGLISVFSLHLVKPGRLPVALGRALNRVEEIRLVADYTGGEAPEETARDAVAHAAAFIAAIQQAFAPIESGGKPGH